MTEEQTVLIARPPSPPEVTPSQMAWAVCQKFIWFLIVAAVIGYVLMLAWNGLTDITTLPELNFKEAVCAWLLLRIVGVNFKT